MKLLSDLTMPSLRDGRIFASFSEYKKVFIITLSDIDITGSDFDLNAKGCKSQCTGELPDAAPSRNTVCLYESLLLWRWLSFLLP